MSYSFSTESDSSEIKQEVTIFEMGLKLRTSTKWDKCAQPKKPDLLDLLERMIKNAEMTDITITIGQHKFKCHRMVLVVYSKFFRELDPATHVSLPPEKVSAQAFHFIYDWMVSQDPKVSRECFMEAFVAANYLKINELIEQCWACINSIELFQEDTAFGLYLDAKRIGDEIVQALMMPRISRFFLTLVASKEFVDFDLDEVITVLNLPHIAVHSEAEILYSAVRWLYHDWDARKAHLVSVIRCVQFGLVPPWLLVEFTRGLNCPEIQAIMDVPEVCKMVNNGLHYVVARYQYGGEQFQDAMERLHLVEPKERKWIGECSKMERDLSEWLMNYYTFLECLDTLKGKGATFWKRFRYVEIPVELKPSNPRFSEAMETIKQSIRN